MEERLIVTDRCYWPLLLQYKKENPFSCFKLVDCEELLDLLSFSWKEGAIQRLMSKGLDYMDAKKWLRLLRVCDASQNEKAQKISGWLEDYKSSDPLLAKAMLRKCKICLLEMDEDSEIQSLLQRKNIPFDLLHLSDFKIPPFFDEKTATDRIDVLSFRNKFQQYFYVFSDIRKRLLETPENQRDEMAGRIKILISDESDNFYLHLTSRAFGIPVIYSSRTPLLSLPAVAEKMARIYQTSDFSFTDEEKENPELAELKRIIETYGIASLPQENERYANLLEIVSSTSSKEMMGDRGIQVTSSFDFDKNSLVYVMDFCDGSFYQSYDDKNVISDAELVKIHANPSYVLTLLDKRKKWNYLCFQNIILLSRVREHLSDYIYDSPFISEVTMPAKEDGKAISRFRVIKADLNENGCFTSEAKSLWSAHEYDTQFVHNPQEDGFLSYSPAFTNLGKGWDEGKKIKRWSISRIESYVRCPYQFYLKQFLKEDDQDYHFIYLGELVHRFMEESYLPSFDYESSFLKGVEAYRKSLNQKGDTWTERDDVLIEIYHDGLKLLLDRILTWKGCSHISKSIAEKQIYWTLQDEEGVYPFSGRVDKIVQFERGDLKYYFIIDYKTGAEKFDCRYVCAGQSIQLPLYYSALEKSKDKELCGEGKFGGFGIQQIYFSSVKQAFDAGNHLLSEKKVLSQSAFKGLTLKEEGFWLVADDDEDSFKATKSKTECKFTGKYIAGKPRFMPDTLRLEKEVMGDPYYSLPQIVEDAERACLNVIHRIENGDFAIAPTQRQLHKPVKSSGDLACSSCSFRDICYRKANDFDSLPKVWKQIAKHFEEDKKRGEAEDEKER